LHHKKQKQHLQRFAKKFLSRIGDRVDRVVFSPAGAAKMSEVLEEFVEPYVEFADNRSQRQQLLEVAVLAWNLALMPEAERQTMLEEAIDQVTDDAMARQNMQAILDELIGRKLAYFADIRRLIVDFELKDTGREYQLSVASLMEDEQHG
jgi:hypothetical protein